VRIAMMMLAAATVMAITGGRAVGADDTEKRLESPSECKKRVGHEVKCFAMEARYHRLMCSMQMQLAALGGANMEQVYECIAAAEKRMVSYYDQARRRLAKNKPGLDALKDAYSYWGSTVRGIVPASEEVRISYSRRQQEREQGLEDRLRRLELEI
jgi:hypothetical protein